MTNIELYINNDLCDTGKNFNVRLNRKLLDPTVMYAKDAQYSYSITLPGTDKNHQIFHYANIEETGDKFNRDYEAELLVNSMRIFKGYFRMSSVTDKEYKGNLYMPSTLAVRDIFGDLKMNEEGELSVRLLENEDIWALITRMNQKGDGYAIFPLALYGLLPKVPCKKGEYGSRYIYDDQVALGIGNLSPSVNIKEYIKKIFKTKGYDLKGNIHEDPRLRSLYMSYKNPPDHQQEWNWGDLAHVKIMGNFSSIKNLYNPANRIFERQLYHSINEDGTFYTVNLFDSNNVEITSIQDSGTNTILQERQLYPEDNRYVRKSLIVSIPQSGLYKIRLKSHIKLHYGGENEEFRDDKENISWVSARTARDTKNNNYFEQKRYEIQLLRDFGKGDFRLFSSSCVGSYFAPNHSQNREEGNDNRLNYPKWFPQQFGKIFVDPSNCENFLIGLKFGATAWDWNLKLGDGHNRLKSGGPMAIKNGYSWDPKYSRDRKIISASVDNSHWRYFGPADAAEEEVEEGGDDSVNELPQLEWSSKKKYNIDIVNIPQEESDHFRYIDNKEGEGQVSSIVWLEKGELITLACVSEAGDRRGKKSKPKNNFGPTVIEKVDFELEIKPFRTDKEWIRINDSNVGTGTMNWSDSPNFRSGSIDLIRFLPSDIKINDFIENFCKAFNLQISQTGPKEFQINTKQVRRSNSNRFINLDGFTSLSGRSNTPLGLASTYKVGFTIDEEEQGYHQSGGYNGGGEFTTGSLDNRSEEQKSFFSYNWYADIDFQGTTEKIPVISKREVWDETMPYSEAMLKRFTDSRLRFWYPNGQLPPVQINRHTVRLARVSEELPGLSILNYEHRKNTILDNYFTLLIDGSSHYTEVEGYLTPEQYQNLDGTLMAMYNGDLYYVAELSGYDPAGKNKTKIKLIRKI